MNTLESVSFSKFNSAEKYTFTTEATAIVKPIAAEDDYLTAHISKAEDSIARVVSLKTITAASEFTGSIGDADDMQDGYLRTAKTALEANVAMADFYPEKAKASALVLGLMDKRTNDLYYGNNVSQQGEIDALFEDIDSPVNSDAVQGSGIAPIFEKIREVNGILKVKIEARRNEKGGNSTITEENAIMGYHMNCILSYIDGHCALGTEQFDLIVTPLNDLITDIMGRNRARRTRKEKQAS